MIKKTITFEDLDGNEISEDFYFHMRKSDLVELQVSESGGLTAVIRQIIETDDEQKLVEIFKKLILAAYGVKSEDNRGFNKSDALRESFSSTDAYSQLFMELATDANAAAQFLNGIMPAGLAKEIEKVTDSKDMNDMTKEELLKKLEGLPNDS